MQCFFPGSCDISSLVGAIDLHQDVCDSQQLTLFLCKHQNKILQVSNVAMYSLRRRNLQLCGSAGSCGTELRGMSRPGSEGHPQRKTPAHTCVPGSHSWHEASAVSQCVCERETRLSLSVFILCFFCVALFFFHLQSLASDCPVLILSYSMIIIKQKKSSTDQ